MCKSIAMIVVLCFSLGGMAFGQTTSHTRKDTSTTPRFTYSIAPSFDLRANTTVSKTAETYNLQLGGEFVGDASLNVGRLNFLTSLDINLAQKVESDQVPERTRDDLIASFTPSMLLYETSSLRLFLELTMVTQMTRTIVDDDYVKTFMDPTFYYQTLYLGQLFEWKEEDKSSYFMFRHGAGYALQQTSYSRFVLTSNRLGDGLTSGNPLNDVQRKGGLKIESGVSYLAGMEYWNTLAPDLLFRLDAFGVLLSKNGFIGDAADSRAYGSFTTNLKYKLFKIGYKIVASYDKNYSKRRKLIQELTVGIWLDFRN